MIVSSMPPHGFLAEISSLIVLLIFHLTHENPVVHLALTFITTLQHIHVQLVIQFVQHVQVLHGPNAYHVLRLLEDNNSTTNLVLMNEF